MEEIKMGIKIKMGMGININWNWNWNWNCSFGDIACDVCVYCSFNIFYDGYRYLIYTAHHCAVNL